MMSRLLRRAAAPLLALPLLLGAAPAPQLTAESLEVLRGYDGRLATIGYRLATANVAGDKVLLLKPQTFMNLSGTSLGAAARFYKVTAQDVLVVHDELDIPFARLALKQGGGSGGHNGLNSIRESWGEEQYARLRFGIGKPTGPNARERVVGHVLGDFSKEERDVLPELIGKSVDICESWTRDGLAKAMNRHNGK